MEAPALSYLVITKNKLPDLKDRMPKLLTNVEADEEILVADGGSTDGSKEYFEELLRAGKIRYFISAPDAGESHAMNKLFFEARGALLKQISDDDVFHYPAIKAGKKFMLEHPEVDILGTDGGFKSQYAGAPVRKLSYQQAYEAWQKERTPFHACGLGNITRRSSLPLTGLWNPSFRRADMEFWLRVTAGKANVAWGLSPSYVNVSNPQSVSLVFMQKIKGETDRLNKFYLDKNPDSYIVERLKVLTNKIRYRPSQKKDFAAEWPALFATAEKWLDEENKGRPAEFLWNKA